MVLSHKYKSIVFFTGAGMSAESGVPTYRGRGGIWSQYNWEEYACQEAFDRDPRKVLKFHELRRRSVLACQPHSGHYVIAELEKTNPQVRVVTQNIRRNAPAGGKPERHGIARQSLARALPLSRNIRGYRRNIQELQVQTMRQLAPPRYSVVWGHAESGCHQRS